MRTTPSSPRRVVLLAAALAFAAAAAAAARAADPLPEGATGIASRHPGDAGIDKDAAVIFVEDFEEPSLDALYGRWDDVREKGGMAFSETVPAGSAGKRSLLMTHVGGEGTGGHLFRRLPAGLERVFARFYIRFDGGCAPMHHFGSNLGGHNPPQPWAYGGAGKRPDGKRHFWTGVEPYGDKWEWDFYTYWQGMRVHGDGNYWGTPFLQGVERPKVARDRWICVEMMVRLNDPVGASNGEQAFWIDGKLWRVGGQIASHIGPGFPKGAWHGGWWQPDAAAPTTFEGFDWRAAEELTVSWLWTYVYITKAPKGHVSKVWFDHIVVAKEYIGPMTAKE